MQDTIRAIVGYSILWKGDHEGERTKRITVQQGLQVMSDWARGEKMFIIDNTGYSTQMISAVEPQYGKYSKSGDYKLGGGEIMSNLPELIASGEALEPDEATERLQSMSRENMPKQLQ